MQLKLGQSLRAILAVAVVMAAPAICSAELLPATIDTFDSASEATGEEQGYEVAVRTFTNSTPTYDGHVIHKSIGSGVLSFWETAPQAYIDPGFPPSDPYEERWVKLSYEFDSEVSLLADVSDVLPEIDMTGHLYLSGSGSKLHYVWTAIDAGGATIDAWEGDWGVYNGFSNDLTVDFDEENDVTGVKKLEVVLSWTPVAQGDTVFLSTAKLSVIPEPSTFILYGVGALGMVGLGLRRRSRQEKK